MCSSINKNIEFLLISQRLRPHGVSTIGIEFYNFLIRNRWWIPAVGQQIFGKTVHTVRCRYFVNGKEKTLAFCWFMWFFLSCCSIDWYLSFLIFDLPMGERVSKLGYVICYDNNVSIAFFHLNDFEHRFHKRKRAYNLKYKNKCRLILYYVIILRSFNHHFEIGTIRKFNYKESNIKKILSSVLTFNT